MRIIDISIDYLENIVVSNFELFAKVGEHSHVLIEGMIPDSDLPEVKKLTVIEKEITVYLDNKPIFHGIPYKVDIVHNVHDIMVKLDVITSTIYMDQSVKTRTFQTNQMGLKELVNYVGNPYKVVIDYENPGAIIDDFLSQYIETDWKFLKRIASNDKKMIIPHIAAPSLTLDVGIVSSKKVVDITEKVESVGAVLDNNIQCPNMIFDDYEFYDLGTSVSDSGNIYYIYGIKGYLDKTEVHFRYNCRRKDGFSVNKILNAHLIGASLNGEVTAVEGTSVQVSLDVDKGNSLCGSRDFAYATIYSSNDGTGWYCMPEIGNEVRLYFPSDREKDAYVISSVHQDVNNGSSERTNSAEKSISNTCGKSLIFSEKSLVLESIYAGGRMAISLDDEDGIGIDSSLPVVIKSGVSIEVNSQQDVLVKGDKIELKMNSFDTSASLNGGSIFFRADEVRIQNQ